MPVSHNHVKTIFGHVIEIESDDERSRFLDKACVGDTALRAEVEELLAAMSKASNFLVARSPADLTLDLLSSERVGTTIGPYRLREPLGEGGMGSVFVAEQEHPIRRKVALKIIKPGMDSREVLGRFDAERQALALMDHPNIAKALDAGTTENGRPYFVMELVRGVPITEFCDQRKLTTCERLKLFVEVCRAIQHAHQKGIIHRDIKPSNVLVTMHDDKAMPKVIDFGIAKATNQRLTDQTVYTAFTQMIGTPLYMSPEQAEMNAFDVDTRSDVYSLGVLLYELLTGNTPFDSETLRRAGFDEMRRLIREVDPPRPSQRISTLDAQAASTISNSRRVDERRLRRVLRGELDWIVMRALEKDRSRRYESASALAADVERYLQDEPVQACPPSSWYRFSKLARRNRAALLTIGLVMLALLVGIVTTTGQSIRATRAERRADSRSQLARRAVDDMYTQVAEKWLAEQGSLTDVQRQFLEKALSFYEEFSSDMSGDPQIQFESLLALERVGKIQQSLGEHASAESSFQRLISEGSELAKRNPERSELRIALVSARTNLGKMYRSLGRVQEANGQAELASNDLQLAQTKSLNDIGDRPWLGATLFDVTGELTEAGLVPQAEAAVQQCLDTWRSLVAQEPDSWDYRFGLANAYRKQGTQRMWWGGRNKEAEESLREAEKRFSQVMQERPDNKACRLARVGPLQNLGVICTWEGRAPESLEFYRLAMSIQETLARDFPDDRTVQNGLVNMLGGVASSLHEVDHTGNYAEIKDIRRRALAVAEQLVDRYPDVVQYLSRYLDAAHLSIDGANDGSLRIYDRVVQRLSRFSIPHESNDEIDAVTSRIAVFYELRAALLIELGDQVLAAESLAAIPSKYSSFRAEIPEIKIEDPAGHGVRYVLQKELEFYDVQILLLRRPSVFLMECARLAEQDDSLSDAERAKYMDDYSARAQAFGAEADRAIETWVQHFFSREVPQVSPVDRVNAHLDSACKEIVQLRTSEEAYPIERRFGCETIRLTCQLLVREALKRDAQDPKFHWAVAYLTAGPAELRDPQLALDVARKAAELRPDDGLARQHLGWALFRSDEWSACVETLLQLDKKPDSYNRAIVAMALWHLGRKDEAAGWLDATYERELKAYIKRCEERSKQGTYSLPTPDMVRRLDQEARELLGELLEKSETRAAKLQRRE